MTDPKAQIQAILDDLPDAALQRWLVALQGAATTQVNLGQARGYQVMVQGGTAYIGDQLNVDAETLEAVLDRLITERQQPQIEGTQPNLPRFPQKQASQVVKWQIVLDSILYSFDDAKKVDSVVTELKRLSEDSRLKEDGRKCEGSSTVVILKGTEAGFNLITSLLNSGQLPEICGLLVEQVSLVSNLGGSAPAPASLTSNPTSPAMTPPKTELTPKERLALSRHITGLTVQEFNDLLLLLEPPAGLIPPPSTSQGDRTYALLNWAQSTTGCGLVAVQTALNDILP